MLILLIGVDLVVVLFDSDELIVLLWLIFVLFMNDVVFVIVLLYFVNLVVVVILEFYLFVLVCSFVNWKKGGNLGIGDEMILLIFDVFLGSRLDCLLVDEFFLFVRFVFLFVIFR